MRGQADAALLVLGLNHEQVFLEPWGPACQRALGIHREGRAVEDHLVLSPHEVCIEHRHVERARPLGAAAQRRAFGRSRLADDERIAPMSVRSFRSVFMVGGVAAAALGCYLVSLRVANLIATFWLASRALPSIRRASSLRSATATCPESRRWRRVPWRRPRARR
mgnify:CR=1 FL=1